METIVDKHPALSLQDIKFAGEFIHGICEPFGFPKSTAMLAESLFWRHLNRTTQRQRATLRELILACLFIAIKLESSDIARNSLFMDHLKQQLSIYDGTIINWFHWHLMLHTVILLLFVRSNTLNSIPLTVQRKFPCRTTQVINWLLWCRDT